jgi:ATP-dependent DNA helicase RecG
MTAAPDPYDDVDPFAPAPPRTTQDTLFGETAPTEQAAPRPAWACRATRADGTLCVQEGTRDGYCHIHDPEGSYTRQRRTTPEPPSAAAPHPEPALEYRMEPSGPAHTQITTPNSTPALHDALRTVPGARWDNDTRTFVIPHHRRTARALRAVLASPAAAGLTARVHPDTVTALRTAADDPNPPPDVTLVVNPDGAGVRVDTPHTDALRNALTRLSATWRNDHWFVPLANAARLTGLGAAHDLTIAPDVLRALDERHGNLAYDGTVDGLRGIPVTELASVASARKIKDESLADRMAEFGIENVYDLLMLVPRRYLDRQSLTPIAQLPIGDDAGVVATVKSVGRYDRSKRLVRHVVNDGTADLTVTFFNSPWQAHRFKSGEKVAIYGKVEVWEGGGRRVIQMTNPVMDPLGDDTAMIVPIYPQSPKNRVTTWDLHTAAMEAVRRLGPLQDPLPPDMITRLELVDRATAYQQVHHPDSIDSANAARTRLAFDELLRMQLALLMAKHAAEDTDKGVTHNPDYSLTRRFLNAMPFPLTGAQTRALSEIRDDLIAPFPAHRLIQGDVGAGKTLVALLAMLMALEGGHQAALMAPTEILAWQLYRETADRTASLTKPDGTPLNVVFLGGKTKAKERREILTGLADGSIDIAVGTHALLVDDVRFRSLGLVVVDEQHRFGVEQRAALRGKGQDPSTGETRVPDMLVMTATPIPRTAAMTVYGDLSVTVLDELPPGRTPISTEWVRADPVLDSPLEHPWSTVRDQVAQGRQAFIVCPLVEESEKLAAASATETYEALCQGALNGLRVGLVHGQMPATERDETMTAFKDGHLDAVVATTVIEVGVNIPNATVMVVLDAPRFGLAQLHQLRGRVGRGQHSSSCYLVGQPKSADGVERMKAMVESTDGFYLSEVDLRLRGAGSVFGTRQAGVSDLKVADVRDDLPLVLKARTEAADLLNADHGLRRKPVLRAEVVSSLGPDGADWLTRS